VVGASTTASAARRGSRTRTSTPRADRDGAINRDALLGALFPKGIPARESVIRDLNAWLDEAERLARRS
jgi:hypothetical protein